MAHYEERLQKDLQAIRERVARVGQRIDGALADAVHAILTRDRHLAARVILGDKPINREIRVIDKLCHGFVARHLPSAGHLRFVSSVLRLDVELERIGDYAVAIAREAVQLSAPPGDTVSGDIQLIADQARRMFAQAMEAFNSGNAELARGTKGMANQAKSAYQKVFDDLVAEGEKSRRQIKDLFAVLVVFNRLGRVSDQAKNICEDTLFAVAGETKGEKVYRILFVDERNDALGRLATAYARKAFPEGGRFSSAGWQPAPRALPALGPFMEAKGLEDDGTAPRSLDFTPQELADFHVIVALDQEAASRIEHIPFHTVLLDWDLPDMPADLDVDRAAAWLEERFPELKNRIRELMETLRGEEAS